MQSFCLLFKKNTLGLGYNVAKGILVQEKKGKLAQERKLMLNLTYGICGL
jgi:hypothetical protein